MTSIAPSYLPAQSGVDEIKAKLCDLTQDLDKFAPEHRKQAMVDRLRQQKLRAMISLAKAQQFLAETDVLIADYNLQAIADEFEHMKTERYSNNTDMKSPQNSERKEPKLVSPTDSPHPSNIGNPKDVSSFTPLLPAVGHYKTKQKATELKTKPRTQHSEAHRSNSKTDAGYTPTAKDIQPINKIGLSEPTTKINEPTSKSTKASSKNQDQTKSKSYKESSSKSKEAAKSKTYDASSSKTKEATTSKTQKPTSSTKEASLANTDLPAPELKSKKRKRSKSKSKERKRSEHKRHKSSHKHAKSSHQATKASNAPAAVSNAPIGILIAPAESTHALAVSSNVPTASLGPMTSPNASAASSNVNKASLGSTASSLAHKASSRASAASLFVPASSSLMPAASHVRTIIAHAPNCDCPKSYPTIKQKTLLNTSISPIKKVVEAKGVQTEEKSSKKENREHKMLAKGVQTDSVIILHVGSQTVNENSLDMADEDTLLLDSLPEPNSHSTAINLAQALQQINSQKTSVLERLCPTNPESFLSQNEVLQKIELIAEDEAGTDRERPGIVKMELPDGDVPNTSTELLVNNLYQDIMKAKEKETRRGKEAREKVTKRGLRQIFDKC